jgi:hypothetical protein
VNFHEGSFAIFLDDRKDKSEMGKNQRKIKNSEENQDIPDRRVGNFLIILHLLPSLRGFNSQLAIDSGRRNAYFSVP